MTLKFPKRQPAAALQPVESKISAASNFKLQKETWIRLTSDENLRVRRTGAQATLQDWKAKKYFTLRVADPSALSLTLDNVPYLLLNRTLRRLSDRTALTPRHRP